MMERLTYWNCKEKGSALPVSIDDDGDVVDLETLCAKLASYEDIGLTPEEVEELKVIKWLSQCGTDDMMPTVFGVPVDRLRELAAADRDGRLVVLPCKVGGLLSKLENLQNSVADDVETYTTGYRNGHRNGQTELIRYILGTGTGSVSEAEAALKEQEAQKCLSD